MWITQPPKIVVKLSEKPPNILDEWNGYPEIFSFSQALEISKQYVLLRTVILKKKKLLRASDLWLSFHFANTFTWLYYVSLVDY